MLNYDNDNKCRSLDWLEKLRICFKLYIILFWVIDPFYRKTSISSVKSYVQIARAQLIQLT